MRKSGFFRQRRSFVAALRGIGIGLCAETHFRFHTVAAVGTVLLSLFYDFTGLHYAVLLLTIASVMAAELFNSAIERLADEQSPHYSATAAAIKDIAAGAVLVCAFFAVIIGICLFSQPEGLSRLFRFFACSAVRCLGALMLAVVLILYIYPGPVVLFRALLRRRKKSDPSERNRNS